MFFVQNELMFEDYRCLIEVNLRKGGWWWLAILWLFETSNSTQINLCEVDLVIFNLLFLLFDLSLSLCWKVNMLFFNLLLLCTSKYFFRFHLGWFILVFNVIRGFIWVTDVAIVLSEVFLTFFTDNLFLTVYVLPWVQTPSNLLYKLRNLI